MQLKRRLDGDVSRSWFFLRTWLPNHLDHFQSQRSISLKLRSNILRFDNICLFFPVSYDNFDINQWRNLCINWVNVKIVRNFWKTQIVLFLCPQGTVQLRKPYYSGIDLILKSRFMTFGFSKSPFLLIFKLFWFSKLEKLSFGFILRRLLSYLSLILTSSQDFRQFLTYKSIYCIIFGSIFSDFCNNHQ